MPVQNQNPSRTGLLDQLGIKVRSHWVLLAMSILVLASFLLKAVPLLEYARVGGDPFLHYKYSMALLDGKFSVPVEAGNTGRIVDLYYPPLFHIMSLTLFLSFPGGDPYAIMKILVTALDALQIIPIYLIVKRVSGSSTGGLLASYALVATHNDYQMLSWGGYANIAALLFVALLTYTVLTDKLLLSAVFSAALALTHHLSTILMIAVLVPYFVVLVWRRRRIPPSLFGVAIGAAVAYIAFYQFAWQSILYYYSNFAPVYNQRLYMTSYVIDLVGPLLLISAAIGYAFTYHYAGGGFIKDKLLLLVWAVVPFLLSYAYLLGVEWHGVRWIHFIPVPLAVWVGVGFGMANQKKLLIIAFALIFTVQLYLTFLGYRLDILNNITQPVEP